MNAAGLIFVLKGVVGALEMPFYRTLVTDGSVSQNEFDGTHSNLSSILAILKNTPAEKIEELVAHYNEDLTAYLEKFQAIHQVDFLGGFRLAQIISGYASTIMAKAGIKG